MMHLLKTDLLLPSLYKSSHFQILLAFDHASWLRDIYSMDKFLVAKFLAVEYKVVLTKGIGRVLSAARQVSLS